MGGSRWREKVAAQDGSPPEVGSWCENRETGPQSQRDRRAKHGKEKEQMVSRAEKRESRRSEFGVPRKEIQGLLQRGPAPLRVSFHGRIFVEQGKAHRSKSVLPGRIDDAVFGVCYGL
jgi:hypothetical protein